MISFVDSPAGLQAQCRASDEPWPGPPSAARPGAGCWPTNMVQTPIAAVCAGRLRPARHTAQASAAAALAAAAASNGIEQLTEPPACDAHPTPPFWHAGHARRQLRRHGRHCVATVMQFGSRQMQAQRRRRRQPAAAQSSSRCSNSSSSSSSLLQHCHASSQCGCRCRHLAAATMP